jgi:hypothetical protein
LAYDLESDEPLPQTDQNVPVQPLPANPTQTTVPQTAPQAPVPVATPTAGASSAVPVQTVPSDPNNPMTPVSTTIDQFTNSDSGETPANAATASEVATPAPVSYPPTPAPVERGEVKTNEFSGAPAKPGSIKDLSYGEAPEEYIVERGDTLFDICDQFLGEPGYWPKLWSYNPEVRNPHFIYPGTKLKFYPGDEELPPFLRVVTEEDMVPIDKGGLTEADLVAEDYSKLLLQFEEQPPAEIIGLQDIVPPTDLIIDYPETQSNYALKVNVPVFVYKTPVENLGVVKVGMEDRLLMGEDHTFVIENGRSLDSNSVYTVLRESGELETPDGVTVGIRYEFVAQVKIEASIKDGYFAGKVVESRLGVRPGDVLVPYKSTHRQISPDAMPQGGGSNVVVGFDHPGMTVGGRGSYVVLEKNSSSALGAGDVVEIYQNKIHDEDLPEYRKKTAVVHIIDDSEAAAVGYVITHSNEIRLGDRAGG